MRKQTRRFACLLLSAVMMLLLSISGLAAGPDSLLVLEAEPDSIAVGETVQVSVKATAAGVVADGKLVVLYNSQVLCYTGVKAGEAWSENADLSLSDNVGKDGSVILAFAGVDAAKAGEVFTLSFTAVGPGPAKVSVHPEKSYITGGDDYSLAAETTMTVKSNETFTVTFVDGYTNEVIDRVTVASGCAAEAPEIPDHGNYYFLGWDKDFSRVTEDMTVTALFCTGDETCASHKFSDVDPTAYYHEGVDFVVRKGYMIGVGDNRFAPDHPMSRGMMVTVLYRMAGSPKVSGTIPFTDVRQDLYYYDAVVWAYQNKITQGVADTVFSPNRDVSRQQMVTFLYRYAEFLGYDTTCEGSLAGFSDADAISPYAKVPMTWAISKQLIYGVGGGRLAPLSAMTRGQLATFIQRFETVDLG